MGSVLAGCSARDGNDNKCISYFHVFGGNQQRFLDSAAVCLCHFIGFAGDIIKQVFDADV